MFKRSMLHIPACCSWPPAAAPADGQSLEPPGGCLSVYAPSPTAPNAVQLQLYHPPPHPLHIVWTISDKDKKQVE